MPRAPAALALTIERLVSGEPCEERRARGRVALQAREEGLFLEARVADPDPERIPAAPPGSRVADLWLYDVAECFWVGEDGRYLEVELGPAGHFLVLSFDAPRRRCDDHADLRPALDWGLAEKGWRASILLPWRIVPTGLCALNAFVGARGLHLAHHPLPGETPDFHQPEHFPAARLG